jgi:hypothetical protein
LVGGVVIIAFSWTRGPASRVWIVWGALLASFVPFGLEAGSRYRDYPSQAPLALAVGALVDEVVCALPVGMARTRQAVGMLAVVVACAAGHRERTDAMEAWREATSEIESCRSEIQTRARIPGAQPPVLVNLELSTRMLLLAYSGMDAQHVLEQPTLAFLDTPVALVPPSDLDVVAENAHELFGRRADGTYDAIDHAILAARPRVEPWKLYGLVRRCDTLGEARRMLASGEVDIRREAVMEAPLESIDAVPMCEVAAAERVEIVTPLSFDGARLVGTIALEASCSSPRWLVAQHPFLYSERLRTGPEYALLGQSEDPRVVELRAQTADGATLEVWRAQAFGFALRVPAGVSRVQLQFYIKGASSLGGQTARD